MDSSLQTSPRFPNQSQGLASITEVTNNPLYNSVFPKRSSLRNLSLSSPVSSYLYEKLPRQPHFLDACFLCKKSIGENKDIYMYRGDVPFCSEECRQEQIEMDEAREIEKKWNLSSKALRKNQKKANSTSQPNKSQPFRTGTVVAA